MSTLARRLHLVDDRGLSLGGFMVSLIGTIALIMLIVFTCVLFGGRAVGRRTCAAWSEQSGYETKFRVLNFFDTGQCFALTPSGRWVPKDQIRSLERT